MIDRAASLLAQDVAYLRYAERGNPSSKDVVQEVVANRINLLISTTPINIPFNLVVRWGEPGDPFTGSCAAGYGDRAHACKIVEIVKGRFPNAHIFLTNIFVQTSETGEKEKKKPTLVPIERFENPQINELLLGMQSPKALSTYLRVYRAALPTLMLDVSIPHNAPTPFNQEDFGQSDRGLNLRGCYHIDQSNGKSICDRVRSVDNSHEWYSSGFGLSQVGTPCLGVHIDSSLFRAHLPYSDLQQVSDPQLSALFKDRDENPPHFYFAYCSMYDERYGARFFHTVLDYELTQKGGGDIDFLFLSPDISLQLLRALEIGFSGVMKSWHHKNLESIEVIFADKVEGLEFQTKIFKLEGRGKRKIRLIYWTKKLPHHDVLHLMQATGKFILVTGDHTFAEAISLTDRIIFYEVMPWKQALVDQLMTLARHQFGEDSHFVKFLDLLYRNNGSINFSRDSMIGGIKIYIEDSTIVGQFEEFMMLLQQRFDFSPWLLGKLNRHLIEVINPGSFSKEQEIVDAIIDDDEGRSREVSQKVMSELALRIASVVRGAEEGVREGQITSVSPLAKLSSLQREISTGENTSEFRKKLVQDVLYMFPALLQ